MKHPKLFTKVLAPFLTFALMFIGAGFISGSIVHLGEGTNPWDISILTSGVFLFVIGSYVQEVLYNGKSLREEGTLSFLFFSLLLSLGIGMVSGGTQHFADTPIYSAHLIPLGTAVGVLAFVLKNNIKLTGMEIAKLVLGAIVFCILLWGALLYVGSTFPGSSQGDHLHSDTAIEQKQTVIEYGNSAAASEKIYVAVEGEGSIAIIDRANRNVIRRISLKNGETSYMPHNVDVSPDGKSVWVTANVMASDTHHGLLPVAHASAGHEEQDQVIIIDPLTDRIVKRLSLGSNMHLAHVAVTPDGNRAIVAAQTKGIIFSINTQTLTVEKETATGKDVEPHGLRITPDGKTVYIALLKGKGIGIYDITHGTYREERLQGASVQTTITPDGNYVAVSQYDTKQVALFHSPTGSWTYIPLPGEAKGPVQLSSTPDAKFIYVADQGYYFGQPNHNKVYKISLDEKKVIATLAVGDAPHGVSISPDGKEVYVTNLASNDVSVIDTTSDKEVARIPVGKEPNGISVWKR